MAADLSLEKTLPSNLEAERSILGAILLDDKAIHTALEIVRAEDFYLESHRRIFGRMCDLTNDSRAIDQITVMDALERANQLDAIGGPAYIANLTDGLPRATNIEHYARIVKEKATLRRLIQISNEIMARSFQSEDSAQEILEDVEKQVFEVAGRQFRTGFEAIEPLVASVYKQIEEVANRKSLVTGVETGFTELDKMTAGFHPSDLIIVAARPGLGKTSICLNIASHVALKKEQTVGIFSLEMSKEQLVKRLLCSEGEIDAHKVNTGYLNKEDWNRLGRAAGSLSQAKVFIDDTAGMSIMEMRSKARRLSLEHGLDLLIVDYLQLMSGTNSRYENRTQEISQISRGLKALAKELRLPVVAISQLNRAVESRRGEGHKPQLSDLRESGCLAGGSLVTLADSGMRVPIRDLAGKSGFPVWALNESTWKLEPAAVSRAFATGSHRVYRLTTRLGRSIEATVNHRFRAFDGWKRLDRLELGERIALPAQPMQADWDAVVSIEEKGVEQVFDLTVPGHHSFVANDLVVHNSIEQDADVVLFIFREELYDPSEENSGIADLIIGKQRNGPTGTFKLAFIKQYTKFANLWQEQ